VPFYLRIREKFRKLLLDANLVDLSWGGAERMFVRGKLGSS
jgi:hypothetical protein